jgi:hypothetical protein
MSTRRNFLGTMLVGVAACAGIGDRMLGSVGELAWPGPIELEIYAIRALITKDPLAIFKRVATTGYREMEVAPFSMPGSLKSELRAAGLATPSGYFDMPATLEDWKKSIDVAKSYGVRYAVVGDNPRLDSEAWKGRADLFNQCGTYSLAAGMQFCC